MDENGCYLKLSANTSSGISKVSKEIVSSLMKIVDCLIFSVNKSITQELRNEQEGSTSVPCSALQRLVKLVTTFSVSGFH